MPFTKTRTMKSKIFLTLAFTATFFIGFAFRDVISAKSDQNPDRKVTGIGGIFFKCQNPAKVREWYAKHLGFEVNQYGAVFEWRQGTDSSQKGSTQWSPFSATTKYFGPSTKDFMINYRVGNLNALLEQLRKDGVTITDSIEAAPYGKFVHIMDIEGNKIELWEPNDKEYEKMGVQMGAKTIK